jgi:hypothetical protein
MRFSNKRFINSKGLLRKGYALPTPTRPYEATCEAEAAAFLDAQTDFCPRRAYRMALWPTRRTLRSLQAAVLYFVRHRVKQAGSGTTLTHCKHQSGLGSARP